MLRVKTRGRVEGRRRTESTRAHLALGSVGSVHVVTYSDELVVEERGQSQ